MARGVQGIIDLTVPGGGVSVKISLGSEACGGDEVSDDGRIKRILRQGQEFTIRRRRWILLMI